MKHAAEVLRAAVPALEKTDVAIALEPLAPAETNFLTTAADGVELIELVGSPRCRLHLDCKAMADRSRRRSPTLDPQVPRRCWSISTPTIRTVKAPASASSISCRS